MVHRRLRNHFKEELKELYISQNAQSYYIHLVWNFVYFENLQHKSVHKNVGDTAAGHNNQAVQKHSHTFDIFPDTIF